MNEAMDSPPFSQCDAKGRCLRHPTVQMSRKKKLGGWKKLLGICPLCAMELMAEDRRAVPSSEASGERGEPSDAASVRSARSSRSSSGAGGRRQRRVPRVGHHHDVDHDDDDDHRSVGTHGNRSVDRSVLSAPAVPYGPGPRDDPRRGGAGSSRRSRPSSKSKRGSLVFSSDSSCDTTVDLSYSSEYSSSGSSSRRGGGRSSSSFHSQGSCTPPLHEEGPPPPLPARDPRHDVDEGEFVCGMELYVDDRTRCFYTGQIHAGTQLPHGLGTLRSDVDGSILEGSWEHGRLVQENGEASPSPSPPPPPHEYGGRPDFASPVDGPEAYPLDHHQEGGYQEEYQRGYVQEYPQECQEGEYDYCHPCAPSQDQDQHQHPEDYQDDYQDDYEGSLSGDFQRCQVDDYNSSFSNSVAETYEGGSSLFGSSDDASSATGSATSGYSARERKSSLPPPGRERERVRRVRFREDP